MRSALLIKHCHSHGLEQINWQYIVIVWMTITNCYWHFNPMTRFRLAGRRWEASAREVWLPHERTENQETNIEEWRICRGSGIRFIKEGNVIMRASRTILPAGHTLPPLAGAKVFISSDRNDCIRYECLNGWMCVDGRWTGHIALSELIQSRHDNNWTTRTV